jgi:cell division protein FtsB
MCDTLAAARQRISHTRGRLILAVILIVALYFVVAYGEQAWKARRLQAEVAERRAAIARLESKHDVLKQKVDRYASDHYLLYAEQVARRDLGLSYPDETTLLIHWLPAPSPSPVPKPSTTPRPAPEPTWQQWLDLITSG